MNEIRLSLTFNYDQSSYVIYESTNNNEEYTKHEKELFCDDSFKSDFFTKYTILGPELGTNSKYTFPLPSYGILDTFWKEQKQLTNEKKNILKLKWIYQLTHGLKDLHSKNKYYGHLSSQCITIDDQKNVRYSFLLNPLEETISVIKAPYFYLAPEYFNDENAFSKKQELIINQSYDVYAFGILINGIIQESFPNEKDYHDLSPQYIKNMLMDPKKYDYPKKEIKDPFWDDINSQIVDACLKINDRPTIFDISKKLDQIYDKKGIKVNYQYNTNPISILESNDDTEFNTPSLVRKLFNFNDIANVLSFLKDKYGSLSDFFDVELFFPSPFKSSIQEIDFRYSFSLKNISSEKVDYVFSNVSDPHFKENYEENEEVKGGLYTEMDSDQFIQMETEFESNNLISNFYTNNLTFCNLKQFIDYQNNKDINEKININREDILTWFIYLSDYMILLENEKREKPLLPSGFSSETILVSLLNNTKGSPQFQFSIFPFPTKETKLSKIYQSDYKAIDVDVYSFGVFMFELLSIIPLEDKDQKVDFGSKLLNSLYSKFQELDESFAINNLHLHDLMPLIENCLTPGRQPTFEEIKSTLCNTEYPIIKGINIVNCINNCDYCLKNQIMDLERLASIAYLLEQDNVHSIISYFIDKSLNDDENENESGNDDESKNENENGNSDESKNENENGNSDESKNENENGNSDESKNESAKNENKSGNSDENNPFKKIFLNLTKSEFEKEFIDPFNFICILYSKDKELSSKGNEGQNSEFNLLINPYLDRLIAIKQKLKQSKKEYDRKCKQLQPVDLQFDDLAAASAYSALTTIIHNWSPLIPHTLHIHVSNNNANESDIELCTLSFLENFAEKNNIEKKVYHELNMIEMYFPRKQDIFSSLDLSFIGNSDDDDDDETE